MKLFARRKPKPPVVRASFPPEWSRPPARPIPPGPPIAPLIPPPGPGSASQKLMVIEHRVPPTAPSGISMSDHKAALYDAEWKGYQAGVKAAIKVMNKSKLGPQTQCPKDEYYNAAKRRMVRQVRQLIAPEPPPPF